MKIGRLGYTESTLLFCHYLRNHLKIPLTEDLMKYEVCFIQWLFNTSGFYDLDFTSNYDYVNSYNYKKLMNELFKSSKESDYTRFLLHNTQFSKYSPNFYTNFNIGEYSFTNVLNEIITFMKDKNVLIINPISTLMKQQYDNGNANKISNLPQVKSIQCYNNEYTFFNNEYNLNKTNRNSFEYVKSIMPKIKEIECDCVIISCGGVSSLIANRLDKDYLIIGSHLLEFFGIKHERIKKENKYNEYWVEVPDELKPPNYKMIENGCYW